MKCFREMLFYGYMSEAHVLLWEMLMIENAIILIKCFGIDDKNWLRKYITNF